MCYFTDCNIHNDISMHSALYIFYEANKDNYYLTNSTLNS